MQADDAAPSGEGGSAELSYRGDVEPIMAAACTCHTTVPAAGGLDLSEGNGYAALVDVEAFGAPLAYVAPGDPQSSYLLHKLDGTQADVGGVGLRMPAGSELTEDQIIVIEDWIEDGAAP